jgi:hypothetical protein
VAAVSRERRRGHQLGVLGEASPITAATSLSAQARSKASAAGNSAGLLLAVGDQALDEQRVAVQLGRRAGSRKAGPGQLYHPYHDLLVFSSRCQQPGVEQLVNLSR